MLRPESYRGSDDGAVVKQTFHIEVLTQNGDSTRFIRAAIDRQATYLDGVDSY